MVVIHWEAVGRVWCFFFFKQKTAYEMQRGLVGSEMCIRDRSQSVGISRRKDLLYSAAEKIIKMGTFIQLEAVDNRKAVDTGEIFHNFLDGVDHDITELLKIINKPKYSGHVVTPTVILHQINCFVHLNC
eukprot:TRINITY_DN53017_c0_g1_i1.p3 TRINITY_DN53017_c0_g1~~TRINITY_DN53017_c0_g1_i1.p3  ORF type:complete len:130 (-),score=24.10 TRINITY_DN53017_c0_g1_i1:146-535(-)